MRLVSAPGLVIGYLIWHWVFSLLCYAIRICLFQVSHMFTLLLLLTACQCSDGSWALQEAEGGCIFWFFNYAPVLGRHWVPGLRDVLFLSISALPRNVTILYFCLSPKCRTFLSLVLHSWLELVSTGLFWTVFVCFPLTSCSSRVRLSLFYSWTVREKVSLHRFW
jgi:hypothetical protein